MQLPKFLPMFSFSGGAIITLLWMYSFFAPRTPVKILPLYFSFVFLFAIISLVSYFIYRKEKRNALFSFLGFVLSMTPVILLSLQSLLIFVFLLVNALLGGQPIT